MAVELGPLDTTNFTQEGLNWIAGIGPDPDAAKVAEARKNFTPAEEEWANAKARLPENPAESKKSAPTAISWGGRIQKDLRVKLEVPKSYLGGLGGGPAGGPNGRPLAATSGIVFPYTPSVSLNNQATYNSISPTHSNYTSNAYKNSSVGPISVSGKFTAQNEYEASLILGVQHLLRSLTKMKWGDDPDAGAPPPVCRFFAYGNSMIDNVPVVVTGWKMEYPDSVDYIQVGAGIKDYGNSFVPSVCTISIDLAVQYSRTEQLNFNVRDFLAGKLAGKGYL
jgi:hypothetical protein